MRMGWGAPLLLLAGCGGTPANMNETTTTAAVDESADAAPIGPAATHRTAPSATSTAIAGSAPASTPAPADASLPEGRFAPDSAQAAADVVQRYHALIAAKRYGEAYHLWEPDAAGMTPQAFAASFATYAEYHAEIGGPGRVDAGAGQRYITVPVRAYGRLRSGGSFAMEGPFTLHRVADIDGSTPEQRQWRIRSSGLEPRPVTGAPNADTAIR